jgi:lipoprotein-anchoring transpeptidase ErfK/SrfK
MKIKIDIPAQQLQLFGAEGNLLRCYTISTAGNGAGEVRGSHCTPRGRHVIRAKIGAGQPVNTVFVARRPTGEIYTDDLGVKFPQRDWILTRILWLSGCEVGFNRLGENDTMRRFIYIHGTPDSTRLGMPGSHGCVRMRNSDLVELFALVPVGTVVEIAA